MTPRDPKSATADFDPRVALAAERTLLAWIRTGLSMMGFGFVVARFGLFLRELAAMRGHEVPHGPGLSLWVGTALVLLGVVVTAASAVQHARTLARLARGEPLAFRAVSLATAAALLLALLGLAMAGFLVFGFDGAR